MCVPLFAIWAGRHHNGPITERPGEVRGGNVNTRVVKLQPLNKDSQNGANEEVGSEGLGKKGGESGELKAPGTAEQR
jgi:hypothetical protein